tara:strand:- start:369 stop:833 length:465 start_codon:yes stop_codon:yes gene_type:complete
MKILIIALFLLTLNCSSNKLSKNHGHRSLDLKFEKIIINETNKNDIIDIIGPPSVKSSFNTNKWIYIERKNTNQTLFKLGIKKIENNNILIVEFTDRGLLKDKKLLDLNDMNDLKYAKNITQKEFKNNSFIYDIFSSMREKINAPSRKTRKKSR